MVFQGLSRITMAFCALRYPDNPRAARLRVCAGHARATSLPGRTLVASRCVVELLDVVHSRRGGMPATELGEPGWVAAVAGWAVTHPHGATIAASSLWVVPGADRSAAASSRPADRYGAMSSTSRVPTAGGTTAGRTAGTPGSPRPPRARPSGRPPPDDATAAADHFDVGRLDGGQPASGAGGRGQHRGGVDAVAQVPDDHPDAVRGHDHDPRVPGRPLTPAPH